MGSIQVRHLKILFSIYCNHIMSSMFTLCKFGEDSAKILSRTQIRFINSKFPRSAIPLNCFLVDLRLLGN